jgi:hypothetical protein
MTALRASGVDDEREPAGVRNSRSLGGRRALVSALLLAGLCVSWGRSPGHADVLAVFGSEGKIGGVMAYRGRALTVVTNVSAGRERAWTLQTGSLSSGEAAPLEKLLTEASRTTGRWGFTLARHGPDAFGVTGASGTVVGVPHGALVAVAVCPVLAWGARRVREWRRRRRGACPACGYDLRHSPGKCPECGWRREPAPVEVGTRA